VSQKIAVSVVFVAALFMTIVDATIVNVALPTLGRTSRWYGSVRRCRLGKSPTRTDKIPDSRWGNPRLALSGKRVDQCDCGGEG
jgi:hypothetical protein